MKKIEESDKESSVEDEKEENLFKVKAKHVPNPNEKPILSISKNRMKKIRNEGLFDGKNITHFDEDMNPISDEEFLKRKLLAANEKNLHYERDFSNKLTNNLE